MGEFPDCMEDMELIDLQLDGELALGLKETTMLLPLDQTEYCYPQNKLANSNLKQSILWSVFTDHVPITLFCGHQEQSKLFKFEIQWFN